LLASIVNFIGPVFLDRRPYVLLQTHLPDTGPKSIFNIGTCQKSTEEVRFEPLNSECDADVKTTQPGSKGFTFSSIE
jgi:hypothetical protein